jgi:LmbE family N-acetylglucosaminyl deacetylase
MAIGAHPDDIEFLMAGTLLRLGRAGYRLHYLNIASGNCGSVTHRAAALRRIRLLEARDAAALLGAEFHPPLCDDLEIFYSDGLLRRLAAVIRAARPSILLVHSPEDYMEDHTNACRLAVTAAFARGMPNYRTRPATLPWAGEVTVYHALPYGLRDGLGRRVLADCYVDTSAVFAQQRAALAAHASQKEWLDVSQGLGSYLAELDRMSIAVGRMSGRFRRAEGWRRHWHPGFCGAGADPLLEALGKRARMS